MAKIVRLFCAHCNPSRISQPDRRVANPNQKGELLPFTESRRSKDRRQTLDRRVLVERFPAVEERRDATQGRRYRDGYAWFDGCIDEVIQGQWYVERVERESVPDPPTIVLCPKCRSKIR